MERKIFTVRTYLSLIDLAVEEDVVTRISSRGSYDNTGSRYNVSMILNADTTFNDAAYKTYSPLFLSYVFPSSFLLRRPLTLK